MKILALDLGDQWVGSAISDTLGIIATPYQTIVRKDLFSFIKETIEKNNITTIIVGHPKTLKGTESLQTQKTVNEKKELEQKFPQVSWILWDERLSSKFAEQLKKTKTAEQKHKSHSVAAAFILQSYLNHLQFKTKIKTPDHH